MRIALTTFDRYDYTVRSLISLLKTKFPENTRLVIVDDRSNDSRVVPFLRGLQWPASVMVTVVQNANQLLCDKNMLKAMRLALAGSDEQYVVTIDNDVLYNPNWLIELKRARRMLEMMGKKIGMVGVFHTQNHSVKGKVCDGILEKNTLGGFCAAINRNLIESPDMRPDQWDWSCVDLCKNKGLGMFCTEKSYVEHFGASGKSNAYKDGGHYDRAIDFVGEEV